jgi:AraC-like DNA-binding protein
MTFTQYRNKQRICLAEQMILEGIFSITDIAYSCGFESLSRFSKVFKQIKGTPPQQFRQKNITGE